jgi:hypothetical protein
MKKIAAALLMGACAVCQLSTSAFAADPLGLYLGGAVGSAEVKIDHTEAGNPVGFDEHQLGWKITVGVRPISVFGAEFEYVDLGHPSATVYAPYFGPPSPHLDIRLHGVAAFAVGYLPLPVPFLDLYAKAGVARLQSTIRDSYMGPSSEIAPCVGGNLSCGGGSYTQSDSRFAWGLGAQVRLATTRLRVRAEYERFNAVNDQQSFLSVGLTWGF